MPQIYNDFGDIYGTFTRDFRSRLYRCRVLITVPQCLEILLLSPANREWLGRLRYVIADEVHCISEASGGEVWERLLLLVRCLFTLLVMMVLVATTKFRSRVKPYMLQPAMHCLLFNVAVI